MCMFRKLNPLSFNETMFLFYMFDFFIIKKESLYSQIRLQFRIALSTVFNCPSTLVFIITLEDFLEECSLIPNDSTIDTKERTVFFCHQRYLNIQDSR